ncbi:Hypothetical predicted protein [Mytilus galloprovincialis]|uniref:Uncharacterized protein n=1 Tax=Mytilus galloprovincialis TaxID=29158 RepID=A0A8B6HHN3_MYTGA|nr:Hypothetical predicted protein [Mytilus galloprovincialis]
MDLHERALRKELGEIVERESKLLYKNTTCKFLCEKTHLKKVTEHLDKWQNVAERDIERQEQNVRKKLDYYEKEKDKYKIYVSECEEDDTDSRGHCSGLSGGLTNKKSFHARPKSGERISGPRSGRRATIELSSPRSLFELKKASSTALALDKEHSMTNLEKKKKHEKLTSEKVSDKCSTFLKADDLRAGRQRRKSLPANVSGIPLLLVTDESGVSDMALTHETQEKSAHEKSVMAKQNALGKGKAVPAAEEEASFYTMAMSSASNRDEFHAVTDTKSRRRGSQPSTIPTGGKHYIDLARLKEVEELLYETSQFRRKQKSATPDSHTARVQMRRLDRLKEILDSLKKKPEAPTFKPMEMLNCSYLRLSKSNVEELEDMVRKAGMDPGIHVHSDLSGYDLFADLKREAEAGKRLHTEDGPSRLTPTPSPTPSRRHSVKSGSSVHH